jgi:hypothetical protein
MGDELSAIHPCVLSASSLVSLVVVLSCCIHGFLPTGRHPHHSTAALGVCEHAHHISIPFQISDFRS